MSAHSNGVLFSNSFMLLVKLSVTECIEMVTWERQRILFLINVLLMLVIRSFTY